jgi:hypothetical protein
MIEGMENNLTMRHGPVLEMYYFSSFLPSSARPHLESGIDCLNYALPSHPIT